MKSALVEAVHSVEASKNYLGAMYRRIAARKGRKRAAISVGHAMLRIAYYLLTREEMYVDLGEDYFDKPFCFLTMRNTHLHNDSNGDFFQSSFHFNKCLSLSGFLTKYKLRIEFLLTCMSATVMLSSPERITSPVWPFISLISTCTPAS